MVLELHCALKIIGMFALARVLFNHTNQQLRQIVFQKSGFLIRNRYGLMRQVNRNYVFYGHVTVSASKDYVEIAPKLCSLQFGSHQ